MLLICISKLVASLSRGDNESSKVPEHLIPKCNQHGLPSYLSLDMPIYIERERETLPDTVTSASSREHRDYISF